MFARNTIVTKSVPEVVWRILSDTSWWHQWNKQIKNVSLKGPFEKLTKGNIFYKDGGSASFRISHYVPLSSYTLSFKNLLADVHIRRHIGYDNHKTVITNEVWAEGALSDLWWALFSGNYIRAIEDENEQIRRLVEAEVPAL